MKACRVTATFSPEGIPRPQSIEWQGVESTIIDIGRRWQSEQGQHMLVRLADRRVLELVYQGAMWQGQVVSHPPSFA